MSMGDFNIMLAAVQKIKAQEFLDSTRIADWPNLKDDAREKLFDECKKLSQIKDEKKSGKIKKYSNKELANFMRGR